MAVYFDQDATSNLFCGYECGYVDSEKQLFPLFIGR
jgi:hypothetical protein